MFEALRPLHDRILIRKQTEHEAKTPGGIILTEQPKDKATLATVVAVGTGRVDAQATVHPMSVKVGDRVVISKYAGTELGEDLVVIREEDILGVLPN